MRQVLAGTGGRLPVAAGVIAVIALMIVQPWVDQGAVRFVFWPVLGGITIVTLVAMVRRLHAMGHSGAWVVLSCIPIVGIGLLLWMMVGARGGPTREVAWRHAVGLVLIVLAGLFIASRALWQPFTIPGGSMAPSVQAGDWVLATRTPEIQRGAVLIFKHPVRGQDFIKRLIGLPGDRIQVQEGRLLINGEAVPQEAMEPFLEPKLPRGPANFIPICANDPVPSGEVCRKDQLVETLPEGRTFPVLEIGATRFDNTGAFNVPDGHVFFLGDNRDNSADSRGSQADGGLGFVPISAIHAQAVRVAFNWSREGRVWIPVR